MPYDFPTCSADQRPYGVSARSGSPLPVLEAEADASIANVDVVGRILLDPEVAGVAAPLASLIFFVCPRSVRLSLPRSIFRRLLTQGHSLLPS